MISSWVPAGPGERGKGLCFLLPHCATGATCGTTADPVAWPGTPPPQLEPTPPSLLHIPSHHDVPGPPGAGDTPRSPVLSSPGLQAHHPPTSPTLLDPAWGCRLSPMGDSAAAPLTELPTTRSTGVPLVPLSPWHSCRSWQRPLSPSSSSIHHGKHILNHCRHPTAPQPGTKAAQALRDPGPAAL